MNILGEDDQASNSITKTNPLLDKLYMYRGYRLLHLRLLPSHFLRPAKVNELCLSCHKGETWEMCRRHINSNCFNYRRPHPHQRSTRLDPPECSLLRSYDSRGLKRGVPPVLMSQNQHLWLAAASISSASPRSVAESTLYRYLGSAASCILFGEGTA